MGANEGKFRQAAEVYKRAVGIAMLPTARQAELYAYRAKSFRQLAEAKRRLQSSNQMGVRSLLMTRKRTRCMVWQQSGPLKRPRQPCNWMQGVYCLRGKAQSQQSTLAGGPRAVFSPRRPCKPI